MKDATPTITLRCWGNPHERAFAEPVFVMDTGVVPDELARVSVVAPAANADRVRELLARGAAQVLVGEAALLDSGLVEALAKEFGRSRVGLWVPVRRMSRSWSLDNYSNADFRCITPSCGAPAWEILASDGRGTATDAAWWIGQMLERGAGCVLVAADLEDDDDLNICAELAERCGKSLWLTSRTKVNPSFADAVRFGQARNLVVRNVPHEDRVALRALRQELEATLEMTA